MKRPSLIFVLIALVIVISALLCACGNFVKSGTSSSNASDTAQDHYLSEKMEGTIFHFPDDLSAAVAVVNLKCKSQTAKLEWVRPYLHSPENDTLKISGNSTGIEFYAINSVQAFDDIIVVIAQDGGDITSDNFYVIDTTGKVLLHVHYLDNNGMYLTTQNYFINNPNDYRDYKIDGDTIWFHGTRFGNGSTLFTSNHGGEGDIELLDNKDHFTNSVPDDEVIYSEYKVQYLGENRFGPVVKDKTTMTYGVLKKTLQK